MENIITINYLNKEYSGKNHKLQI